MNLIQTGATTTIGYTLPMEIYRRLKSPVKYELSRTKVPGNG